MGLGLDYLLGEPSFDAEYSGHCWQAPWLVWPRTSLYVSAGQSMAMPAEHLVRVRAGVRVKVKAQVRVREVGFDGHAGGAPGAKVAGIARPPARQTHAAAHRARGARRRPGASDGTPGTLGRGLGLGLGLAIGLGLGLRLELGLDLG